MRFLNYKVLLDVAGIFASYGCCKYFPHKIILHAQSTSIPVMWILFIAALASLEKRTVNQS